jgi:hypothetical protein
VDLFGNRTDVSFESMQIDRHPDPASFRFQAGPGVRVLRAPEASGRDSSR